ncbi:MAG: hypothetical protein DWI57_10145 [Chloroflexi bacterium]|nr:MAG: hypothetical protein DWI57_10145 [Chloroflexota bacterium]
MKWNYLNAETQRHRDAEKNLCVSASLRLCVEKVTFALFLVLITGLPAAAQAPERREAFVWATTVFAGVQYESTFTPSDSDTLYLLADASHVLAPRSTLVYDWPITNRLLADWLARNELVEGTLFLRDSAGQEQRLALTDYVIQFDGGAPAASLALYSGSEAMARYAAFDQARSAYAQALHAQFQLEQQYQAGLTAAAQAATKGEKLPIPDGPPPPLPPFTRYSTEVKQAFVLDLPAGEYTLWLERADGSEEPTSRKRLVVFAPRRYGVGYSVMPASKWTVPEQSDDPRNAIYALPGSTFYLQPFTEFEVNELAYGRMIDAQAVGVHSDRYVWVHTTAYPSATMQLFQQGQAVADIANRPYFVRQLPGASLGYQIEAFDLATEKSPSFVGYAIDVQADQTDLRIQLVDGDGEPVPGSSRAIRPIRSADRRAVYALSLLPLLVGGAVLLRRWTRVTKQ